MGWYKVVYKKYPIQTKNLYEYRGIGKRLRKYNFKKVHKFYNEVVYYKTMSDVLNSNPSKIYRISKKK